jgi:hypothetical protein
VTTGQRPGAGDAHVVQGDDRGAVIEMDQPADERQRALPWRRISLVVALLALAGGGYAASRGRSPAESPPVTATQPPPVEQAVQLSGGQCGMSDSSVLQVGATFTNVSREPVTAQAVTLDVITTPLHGLRLRGVAWGLCNAPPVATGPQVVPPGETFGFYATFDLLTKCPAMTALDFTIVWRADGMQFSTPVVVDDPVAAVPNCGQRAGFGGGP